MSKSAIFITNSKIFPQNNGAVIYTNAILKSIASSGLQITLVNFYNEEKYSASEKEQVLSFCSYIHEVKLEKNILNRLNIIRPVKISKYICSAMTKELNILKKHTYDLAIFDHLHMAYYIKHVSFKSSYIVEHNLEFKVWFEFLRVTSYYLKPIVFMQYLLMKKYEMRSLKYFDNVITISSEDKKIINSMDSSLNNIVFNPIIDSDFWKSEIEVLETKLSILFVGSFKWFPNKKAADFLINDVMKKVSHRLPNITLYLVGTNPSKKMITASKKNKNIVVTGRVNSIDDYIKKSDVFINPVEHGSGINVKLLEAISKGIPVVSSEFGVRGVDLIHEIDVLIYRDLKECIENIIKLLNDPTLRLKIRNNAAIKYEITKEKNKSINWV